MDFTRRIILAVACLAGLACQQTLADDGEWTPKLVDGRTWNIIEEYFNVPIDTVSYQIRIDGTTEAGGHTCYRFLRDGSEYALMREEEGRLLSYNASEDAWDEVYDFSMQVGDRFRQEWLPVTLVDTVYVNGTPCRRLFFDIYSEDDSQYFWVEGFGNKNTGPFLPVGEVPVSYMGSTVMSVYDGDVCVYEKSRGFVTSSVDAATAGRAAKDGAVYDLQGRRISGRPASGMYISNGRKYAVGR